MARARRSAAQAGRLLAGEHLARSARSRPRRPRASRRASPAPRRRSGAAPKHAQTLSPGVGRHLLDEPALANTELTIEREKAAATGDRAIDPCTDFGQFAASADEVIPAGNRVQVGDVRWVQAGTTNRILPNFMTRR
jgi:hypothetical protein